MLRLATEERNYGGSSPDEVRDHIKLSRDSVKREVVDEVKAEEANFQAN